MDNALLARFDAYCQKYHISMNKAAQGIGYTAGVISQWRKGEYKGDIDAVEAKIRAWLELQEAREEAGVVPFVPLKRTSRIKTAVRVAHEEKFIGLVLGNSGAGKSRALEEYTIENPNTTVLVKCDPTMGLSTIVSTLARELGLDPKGRISEISDRIVAELRKRDMCVIFDEADYLTDQVLEWARIAINDKGGSALVLSGLPRIEYRIHSLKSDHRQLENRVGMRLNVEDVGAADVREILAAVWPDLDPESGKVFEKSARQSLHILIRHIALTKRVLRQSSLELPTAELVSESASFLFA
jgi:DNA transposition AAA+ family ATPase